MCILGSFCLFYCHLVYCVDFMVIWYILSRFGMLYQEKSGNPGQNLRRYLHQRVWANLCRHRSYMPCCHGACFVDAPNIHIHMWPCRARDVATTSVFSKPNRLHTYIHLFFVDRSFPYLPPTVRSSDWERVGIWFYAGTPLEEWWNKSKMWV
jgi:hypothetical protein